MRKEIITIYEELPSTTVYESVSKPRNVITVTVYKDTVLTMSMTFTKTIFVTKTDTIYNTLAVCITKQIPNKGGK